jgi:DNA-binding SARP family transcriptional activator/tetratricopeptide (TPR) repeat protein
MMASEPRFCLLGPLLVRQGPMVVPIPAGKQRVLMAALLLNPDRALSADELAELLWETGPPASARDTVQNYVRRLRQALGDAGRTLLTTQAEGYLLRVLPDDVDVLRFETMTARGLEALHASRHDQAADELREALALWRGTPLVDVPSDHLVVHHARRLEEMRLQALEGRIEADLWRGRHSDVAAELQALVGAEPLRERLRALLMLALYRDARQADALAVFRDARRVLIDEVGVEPGVELQRLHRQILDADPALNVSVASAPETVPAVVPRQLPTAVAHFVGREPELSRLDALAAAAKESDGAVVIAVIGGTAGVGKTALAVQWAHRAAGRFPDGQLYVDLRGFGPDGAPKSPGEALGGFLLAMQPAMQIPAGIDARAGLYRSLTADKRLLVVLDNARDVDQVRPLLPGSPGSMVLVTSRDRLPGLAAAEGAHLLTLDVLGEAEAEALVVARAGTGRAAERGAVAEIAELCSRLPLALAVAAARAAARPALSLAELAAELRDVRNRLDALDPGDPSASARAVFSWSHESLTPPAARLFRLLGLHPGPDIGVSAAASLAGVSAIQGRVMLGELARSHVVAEPSADRFGLHDLLKAYARERIQADEHYAATNRMVDYYLHTAHAMSLLLYPPREAITLAPAQAGTLREDLATYQQAWSWAEAECLIMLEMVPLAANTGLARHAWQLAWALEIFLSRSGRWDELAQIQQVALGAARQAGDVTGQAHAHCGVGWTSVLQGRYEDGTFHLGRAALLFRQLGDGSGEARAHVRAYRAFWQEGRHEEAFQSAQRALSLYRASGYRAGQAGALNNIAMYHIHLGDYERALDCCRQALAVFRELGYLLGEANVLDSLGDAYHGLGRPDDAIACYQESLAAFRELGDRHNQAEILIHLAVAYRASGADQDARRCLEQALAILTELKHRDAAQVEAMLRDAAAGTDQHLLAVGSQASAGAGPGGDAGSHPGS